MHFDEDILLIAGPTAGGKTALSIKAAQDNDAIIINTDSMQVYGDLQILSARPSIDEIRQAPHHLFGHVDGSEHYSVARWLSDVQGIVRETDGSGRKLIFVGGTGLYFNALLEGLSPVPEIDPETRNKWRELSKEKNSGELYRVLAEADPEMANSLEQGDTQRIVRALEVFESTGKSLLEWQNVKGKPLFGDAYNIRKTLILPERKLLHDRIHQRFDQMMEAGALEEVRALLSRNLDPSLPVMKAIGVPQLTALLGGTLGPDEAVEKAKAATRQYAKRQSTWFRNSFDTSWIEFTG